MDRHIGGKSLIYGTKQGKGNQLQSLDLPCKYPSWEYKSGREEFDSNMFNPIF